MAMLASPRARWLTLALALSGCTAVPEERTTDPAAPEPSAPADAPAPVPSRVVGASLLQVADIPQPVDARIAFGPSGTWWQWDGEQATAWLDGEAQPARLDAAALVAAGSRPAVDHPLAIGSTVISAKGSRPLHDRVVSALRSSRPPWGYFDTGATFDADGRLLIVTQAWVPSACCRAGEGEHEPERPPPSHVGHIYDTTTGTEREVLGVAQPVAVGREMLVLGGRTEALHHRDPFYPLDSPLTLDYGTTAVALGMGETVIASASTARPLQLHRARDGALLHAWNGPPMPSALAFHPAYPLLAAAGADRLEIWRVDLAVPTRLAHAPLAAAPKAILFHPDGHRLLLTGARGAIFELSLTTEPIGGESSTPLDLALLRDDPAIPPLRAGRDAIAIALDDDQVHAYGRGQGLYSFDRTDGQRVRSWRRHGDEGRGVVFAARAPVLAVAERHDLHREEPPRSRRVDVIDARTYATVATTWISPGELGHLVLSPRGTALAWSVEHDPLVELQDLRGRALLRMTANTNDVEAVAISDDDQRLAVANRHVTDNIWVGTVGETKPVVVTTPRGVSRLLFSRDGERLFVMDFDGKIHVVDPTRVEHLTTFDPKAGGVGPLVETPDGRHLAIARAGVVVLDASTGVEVARFPIAVWLRAIAAAPDGRGLAVGDGEGTVHLLSLP